MNNVAQIAIDYHLTPTQVAILFNVSLEGEIDTRNLRLFSGISDRRTLAKAIKEMQIQGLLQVNPDGKIQVKLPLLTAFNARGVTLSLNRERES